VRHVSVSVFSPLKSRVPGISAGLAFCGLNQTACLSADQSRRDHILLLTWIMAKDQVLVVPCLWLGLVRRPEASTKWPRRIECGHLLGPPITESRT